MHVLVDFKLLNRLKRPKFVSMKAQKVLTTIEAAAIAGVGPSTVKRWADRGLLPVTRTAGGHRRFERGALERLVRGQLASEGDDPALDGWVHRLLGGARHEVDGALLAARARLGAWYRVADEVGAVLA